MWNYLSKRIYVIVMMLCLSESSYGMDALSVPQDDTEAQSHMYMGQMFIKGSGCDKNYTKAHLHFVQALELARSTRLKAWACIYLGAIYSFGWGVLKEHSTMELYLSNACNHAKTDIELDEIREAANILRKRDEYDGNAQDENGDTPLHRAVKKEQAFIVYVLVEMGVSVSTVNNKGCTPLHYAMSRDVAELLIAAKAPLNVEHHKIAPLHAVSMRGTPEAVCSLLDHGAEINAQGGKGHTPLILAVLKGSTDTVRALLSRGAEVSLKSDDGRTALVHAAYEGKAESASLLLEYGADPDEKDSFGFTAYQAAAIVGSKEVIEVFMRQGIDINEKKLLYYAISWGVSVEAVKAVLACGAEVTHDESVLCSAAEKGKKEVVQLLLDCGININVVDKWDNTALERAANKGHTEIVTLLLAHEADVNRRDKLGKVPLHQAAYQVKFEGNIEVVRALIAQGADVNAVDNNGKTPLHSVAYLGNIEVMKLLVQGGARVNVSNEKGVTPLHNAVDGNKIEAVKYLLEHGASLACRNNYRQTALELAEKKGYNDIVQLLHKQPSVENELHKAETLPEPSEGMIPDQRYDKALACIQAKQYKEAIQILKGLTATELRKKAWLSLGELHKNGQGGPKNEQKAFECFAHATSEEVPSTKNDLPIPKKELPILGNQLYDNALEALFAKEYAKARRLLTTLIEHRSVAAEIQRRAYLRLGELYTNGHGVPKNYEKAFSCFTEATK